MSEDAVEYEAESEEDAVEYEAEVEDQDDEDIESEEDAEELRKHADELLDDLKDQEALFDIEIDGKTLKVPEHFKNAFLKNADYTHKTTELARERETVAELRKQADDAINFVTAHREDYANLSVIDKQIAMLGELDWNEVISNAPTEAMKLQHRLNELNAARQDVVGRMQNSQAELVQKAQEEQHRQRIETAKVLKRDIPGFNEDSYRAAVKAGIDAGFNEREVMEIVDHRIIKILHAAAEYNKSAAKLTKQKPVLPASAKAQPSAKVEKGKPINTVNPDKMSGDEWRAWREKELAKERNSKR